MDRTVSTGSLVLAGESRRDRPSASAGPPPPAYPPIYAALLGEWQAAGRMVPGAPDAQWDALVAAVRASRELPAPALRPPDGRGERIAGLVVAR
ncbi:hypothetical protein [Streptomyces sp. enrichment culture]|uniref:hypothetical protein n=1 Tax=Streptomyces sp. enrichment culture TaxID=1795815 RepID=UPI003F560BDD